MQNFELDLQFMSKLSQIAQAQNKEDFLDEAKKIIEGKNDDETKSEQLLKLGTSIDTDNDEVLNLDENETNRSTMCFKAADVGNLDSNTVLGIIDSQDLSLKDFLQTLRVEAFQSDHFLSNMANSFYEILRRNVDVSLYDFLQTAIDIESKEFQDEEFIDLQSNEQLKKLLTSVTLGQLMMADLVHGRMISPFEKYGRKCATKTDTYDGKALYTKDNYRKIFETKEGFKYSSMELLNLKEDEFKQLLEKIIAESPNQTPDYTMINNKAKKVYKEYDVKAQIAKKIGKENFFKWISLLKEYSENYNNIFTNLLMNDVFGRLSTQSREQTGEADEINPEIAVAIAVNLVHGSNPESSKKTSNTELTVLFRKYTVIVYDRLIELTLGENFNDLMETQEGYGDFRINNFKKVFVSINDSDNVLLLQEFDESYKTKNIIGRDYGIFEETKLKKGSASAIYCNGGAKVDIKIEKSDVVAASVTRNEKKILFVSFHANSKGTDTKSIIDASLVKFKEEKYDFLIIGADTNAKKPKDRDDLSEKVAKENGKLYTIGHEGNKLPTSIGMRSLLQSQFSKALDSIEETIDYLMIFGKGDDSLSGLKVDLNTDFYKTSREGLSIGNPSDHIPLFFEVTLEREKPPLKILTYNMAGPNTNVVEYMKYKDAKSYKDGIAHISEYEKLSALEILPGQTDNEEIKKIAVSVVVANESQSQ